MAIIVNIQPSEQTVTQYVRRPDMPPSLAITDGSATVWFSPHNSPDGPILAAEFADRIVNVAGRWREACWELSEPARQRPYAPEGR